MQIADDVKTYPLYTTKQGMFELNPSARLAFVMYCLEPTDTAGRLSEIGVHYLLFVRKRGGYIAESVFTPQLEESKGLFTYYRYDTHSDLHDAWLEVCQEVARREPKED